MSNTLSRSCFWHCTNSVCIGDLFINNQHCTFNGGHERNQRLSSYQIVYPKWGRFLQIFSYNPPVTCSANAVKYPYVSKWSWKSWGGYLILVYYTCIRYLSTEMQRLLRQINKQISSGIAGNYILTIYIYMIHTWIHLIYTITHFCFEISRLIEIIKIWILVGAVYICHYFCIYNKGIEVNIVLRQKD